MSLTSLGDVALTPIGPVTLNAVADAHIDQPDPNTNKGLDALLPILSGVGFNHRALLMFDLSPLAGVPSITSAILSIYYSSEIAGVAGQIVEVDPVTSKDWTELGATWNSRITPALPWITPGGDFTTALQALAVFPAAAGVFIQFDVTSYVNALLAAGDLSFEMLLKFQVDNQSPTTGAWMIGREFVDPARRPVLVVQP